MGNEAPFVAGRALSKVPGVAYLLVVLVVAFAIFESRFATVAKRDSKMVKATASATSR